MISFIALLLAAMNVKVLSKSWEIGRFAKTALFYGALRPPKLPFFPDTSSSIETKQISPGFVIWSTDGSGIAEFGPLDDVVMGGASKTDLEPWQKFEGNWTGFVTTENNGGFAGIRTKLFSPALDASACRGLSLSLRGDGNRYKFIARDDKEWNGVAWSFSFDTSPGQQIEVKVPFTKLVPTRFARTVPGGSLFNSRTLTAIQISLSKFEYDGGLNKRFKEGPFNLFVDSIRTF